MQISYRGNQEFNFTRYGEFTYTHTRNEWNVHDIKHYMTVIYNRYRKNDAIIY